MKSLKDAQVAGKTVFVRVDFNVPMDNDGNITDDRRIRSTLPTIQWLLDQGAAVVLASHLGRPKGHDPKYSLKQLHNPLSEMLGRDVFFVEECVGPQALHVCKNLEPGDVALLENLRFYEEEAQGNPEFAAELSWTAQVYVNDAFGTAHRPHASVSVLPTYFPKDKYAGFLLSAEIENAERVLNRAEKPYFAVIGGAKVADKIPLLEKLLPRLSGLVVGGGMAFTFLKARGKPIGDSLCEDDHIEAAQRIMLRAQERSIPVILPVDVVVAPSIDQPEKAQTIDVADLKPGMMALDIGPKTVALIEEKLASAKTVLWNGPMGVFEQEAFADGTKGIAEVLSRLRAGGTFVLVGGGDTANAVDKLSHADNFSFVSTGGGALLEYLEGKTLPGIAALKQSAE